MNLNPLVLEILVLLIGLIIFGLESFREELAGKSDEDRQKFTKKLVTTAVVGLFTVFLLTFFVDPNWRGSPEIARFYAVDWLSLSFKQFALICTILVLLMSLEFAGTLRRYIFGSSPDSGLMEFLALPIFTCAGLMFMAGAKDLVMIFVSLELVTMSFYILVSYMRRNVASLEAGAKYLILGALSTGFLVYGITWVFGVTGQTDLREIGRAIAMYEGSLAPLLFGFALITVGLGFKVAAVPFQIWVPDVYQGAPTPITAYLSVASKAAGFVVLLRVVQTFYNAGSPELRERLVLIFAVLAVLTLLYGNLGALPQLNVKRLLAYSSIAHAGYLLIGVVTGNMEGIAFYLWAYLLMTMLSFFVLVIVAKNTGGEEMANFNGLLQRDRLLGSAMILAMLSLAGLPFTVGFIGKLLIFKDAIAQQHFFLCTIGAISVAIGFYYYLKVVWAMCLEEPINTNPLVVSPPMRIILGCLMILIIGLGVFPAPLQWLMNNVALVLF
jgi:NADH-quinone oxidoreductase subunit N